MRLAPNKSFVFLPFHSRIDGITVDNSTTPCWPHLHGNTAPSAVVVHEDTQHVRDELRQVKLEFSTQGHYNLLNQEDDGVLHGVVWGPVILRVTT